MQHAFDAILTGLLGELRSMQPSLFSDRCTVLLAVSGGIDSMCMAELFRNTHADIEFALAHCNFCLRGEDSDSDEALVSAWAEAAGVRLHKTRFDTAGYARERGISIEMAARDLRYGWFSYLCAEFGYSALAVAHNANDNVETLFLNLLRGTGIKGLSGMKRISCIPVSSDREAGGCPLIRPLLDFTRNQIEGYVFAHKVDYHEDRTNAETEYKRNKLRNLVFPLLEQINPAFIRTLGREMAYFSQVGDIADDYYRSRLPSLLKEDGADEGCEIDIRALRNESGCDYILYRLLENYGFNHSVISSVSDLLKSKRTLGGKVFRSEGYVLVTSGDSLIVRRNDGLALHKRTETGVALKRKGTLPDTGFGRLSLSEPVTVVQGPGNYFFNGVSFSVSAVSFSPGMSLKVPKGTLLVDRAAMDFPFICRRWNKGDWMVPFGMRGRKKISDMFTDMKYSLIDKERAVVAVKPGMGSRVCAVLGVRIDDSFRVTDGTSDMIMIKILDQ